MHQWWSTRHLDAIFCFFEKFQLVHTRCINLLHTGGLNNSLFASYHFHTCSFAINLSFPVVIVDFVRQMNASDSNDIKNDPKSDIKHENMSREKLMKSNKSKSSSSSSSSSSLGDRRPRAQSNTSKSHKQSKRKSRDRSRSPRRSKADHSSTTSSSSSSRHRKKSHHKKKHRKHRSKSSSASKKSSRKSKKEKKRFSVISGDWKLVFCRATHHQNIFIRMKILAFGWSCHW